MGHHHLVPFAMEESGRFGDHALALLREIASRGVRLGFLKPPPSWLASKRARVISYWVDHWLQDISSTLALHLATIVVDQVGT